MAADGSIVIKADLDDKQAQAELNRLTKKIDGLNDKIASKKQERMPLVEQAQKLGAELDAAKATLDHMKSGEEFFPTATVDAQVEKVKTIQKEWNAAQDRVDKVDAAINKMTGDLDRTQANAGEVAEKLAGAGSSSDYMGVAIKKADDYVKKFTNRVKGLARRVLFFSVITMALRQMRTWLGNVVKTSPEATAAIAKLKGALLTLAQPLVNVIIPAFTAFVNVLTRVINSISSAISMLFGSTIDKSAQAAENLYNEQQALEGVGSAAKSAGKSMASFDEINQLSGSDSSGGGSSSSEIAPDFDFDTAQADGLLSIIEAIGAALLAWRISSALEKGLNGFLGLLVAIYSAIEFVKNMMDAWANGVSWENLSGMILGAAGVAAGLALALGKTAAAVSLLVTGIAMLATGFHDMIENGMTWENTLLSIAGIMATGIGISILTGSWIPALIAGIASAGLAMVKWAGHGEEFVDGLKTMFQGFSDLLTALVNGDMAAAGEAFKMIWEGAKLSFTAVIDSVELAFQTFVNWFHTTVDSFMAWLKTKVSDETYATVEWVVNFIVGHIDAVIDAFKNAWTAIKQIFNGIIEFLSGVFTNDWDKAWDGLKNTVKGTVNLMLSLIEGFVNIFVNAINTIIDLLNSFKVDVPDWVPVIGGKKFTGLNIQRVEPLQIPRLAQGAVIPPNREFMAVLGDQSSGTNVEAPLATIKQALAEVLAANQTNSGGDVVLQIDGKTFARLINPYATQESNRVGIKLVNGV